MSFLKASSNHSNECFPGAPFLARPSLLDVEEHSLPKEESLWTIERQHVQDRPLHLHS